MGEISTCMSLSGRVRTIKLWSNRSIDQILKVPQSVTASFHAGCIGAVAARQASLIAI